MASNSSAEQVQIPIQEEKKIRQFTLEEYLRREARSTYKHEFLQGQIIRMPFAKGPHNEIAANLIAALKTRFKHAAKIYRVFSSDQKIYFPILNEGVYADALVVSEQPLYWDKGQLLLTNPLLVVEILSRSTKKYDKGDKFMKYKTATSFREYVMVEQTKCYIEVWFQETPGLWRETIITDPKGKVSLRSVDCEITVADIYEHIVFE